MAISDNLILKDMHGAIGKQIVVKQYGNRTVISNYPDMSNIIPSGGQLHKRNAFKQAVAYAKAIINNPTQKALYAFRVQEGQTVYHYALKEYLQKTNEK